MHTCIPVLDRKMGDGMRRYRFAYKAEITLEFKPYTLETYSSIRSIRQKRNYMKRFFRRHFFSVTTAIPPGRGEGC
jgi:hypothetical protein